MRLLPIKLSGLAIIGVLIATSCAKNKSTSTGSTSNKSTSTGWDYNNYKNGGFERIDAQEQETGPGLVLIEGGVFTMGRTEQDVMFDWNSRAAKVTVGSFYLDKSEVTNLHWLEYINWMKRVYHKSYPHVYKKSLPDTLAWRKTLGYREKFVDYYLRHPSYRDYPVVGVTWLQANEFCKWRTDRVNESILVREGILKWHFADLYNDKDGDIGAANKVDYEKKLQSRPENMFSTENYLNGNYTIKDDKVEKYFNGKPRLTKEGKYELKGDYGYTVDDKYSKAKEIPRDPYQLTNYDPLYADLKKNEVMCLGKRAVKMEDGILLPNYRLPTEAEWEFAALGLIGNLDPESENINDRRIYPWDGHYVRQEEKEFTGSIQANFMRGKGDMMGVAGNLNDGGDVTVRVDQFWPNDYGLYHMAGNVSEWVMDVYRPMSSESFEEFMPFRGNVYKTQLLVPNGLYDKPVKAMENLYDVHGMKEYVNEYARVMYLSNTNLKIDGISGKYIDEYTNDAERRRLESEKKSEIYITSSNIIANNKDSVVFRSFYNGGVKTNLKYSWSVDNSSDVRFKDNKQTLDSAVIWFNTPGKYNVSLSFKDAKNITTEKVLEIEVRDYAKNPLINSNSSNSRINQRQDQKKYRFNTLSKEYLSNNKSLSEQERKQFLFLDTLNMHIDTAIFLMNANRQSSASAYIENALFGNKSLVQITKGDIRGNNDQTTIIPGSIWLNSNDDVRDPLFGKNYLDSMFTNFRNDPTISTWIITLRNGLTEFITDTRGKQRWRNVTVEENVGRLNYRKDDYRDYLDGDLESSIYYNNQKRKDDINQGKRDPKQVMYQNQFENKDLDNQDIAFGSSGAPVTLISDKSRVYKGGSWADRAYWLSAGNRRFLDEDKSSDAIGFRCAMDRLGSPTNGNRRK